MKALDVFDSGQEFDELIRQVINAQATLIHLREMPLTGFKEDDVIDLISNIYTAADAYFEKTNIVEDKAVDILEEGKIQSQRPTEEELMAMANPHKHYDGDNAYLYALHLCVNKPSIKE